MLAPKTQPGPLIKLDQCEVKVGEPTCSDALLQLPRQVEFKDFSKFRFKIVIQACLAKINRQRIVYQVEENLGYVG